MTKTHITKAPCAKCPFRKDVPCYLRRARRVEIATSLLNGAEFPCHNTTVEVEDDEGYTDRVATMDSKFCSGAAKSLLLAGTDNQMLRIMERLGSVDLDEVEAHPVEVWSIVEWQQISEGQTGDSEPDEEEEDVETCNTVNGGCLAPAGYAIGGSVTIGTVAADGECASCGEGLCSNCADKDGNCINCTEYDEDEDE